MNTTSISFKRLLLLGKKEFHEYYKNFMYIQVIIFVIIMTAFLVGFFLTRNRYAYADNLNENLLPFLFIGGFVYTLLSFRELKAPAGRTSFLALPATTFEKVSIKWFFQAILHPIGIMIIYTIIHLLYKGIVSGIYGHSVSEYALQNYSTYQNIFWYIMASSVVLFASATFNNHSFFKLLFWGFGIFVAFALINLFFASIIFPELRDQIFGRASETSFNLDMGPNPEDHIFLRTVKWIVLYVTPFYFWVLTYFKIKEKEV